MQLSNNWLRLIAVIALASIIVLVACESDADRIRSINDADRTQTASSVPTSTPTPLSAEIDFVDIQDGDCVTSSLPEGVTIESVVIVPCSGAWEYRVLNSFDVTGLEDYPGKDYLSRAAFQQCDNRYTYILYPAQESWESRLSGDRTIRCLQHSFGLAETDPDKLDRLVSVSRLDVGECYNDAPETGGLQVELVGCSGDWEYRVLSSFGVADSPEYPGEDYFSQLAREQCDRRFAEFLYPPSESWAQRDRTVSCLQPSFGLSTDNPAKLDRLVSPSHLDVGECYNEAPETGGLLVELVGCSCDWELQIVDVFSVAPSDAFPGYAYLQDQANSNCPTSSDYFYTPNRQTWGLGDREVTCVRTP